MNIQNYNPKITERVALRTGEDPKLIKQIFNTAVEFVTNTIAEGSFQVIQLPYLGKFVPNYTRIGKQVTRKMIPKPDTIKDATV
jgi:nucleoid DNA-binding protein